MGKLLVISLMRANQNAPRGQGLRQQRQERGTGGQGQFWRDPRYLGFPGQALFFPDWVGGGVLSDWAGLVEERAAHERTVLDSVPTVAPKRW